MELDGVLRGEALGGAGLRPARVAEIIVSLPGGRGRRGSGYRTAAGSVLTAGHVVAGAARVTVRFDADRPGQRTVEAAVVWQHTGIDVAVLAIQRSPDAIPRAADVESVPFGRVGEQDAVLRCSAVGFPRFKLRTDHDRSRYRDSEHVHATCAVLSNRRQGTLDLSVTPPSEGEGDGASPWEGMSGAAVLSSGRIVGIVAEHHRSDGPGRLTARRVDRWAEQLTPGELSGLEQALGCSVSRAALDDVVPSRRLWPTTAAFQAGLREIAPEELLGRQDELRQLTAFCGGNEPYLWIQGRPWAGKTALAAWFALYPPRGVVPVWFFILARRAGESDSAAYTDALTQQLAAIAECEPVSHSSAAARAGERRLLLEEAAKRVAADGGTLLLVIDGLDEDRSGEGGGGPSIASLLPERLPSNVRVLVTSRPSPGVPPDVHGGHPLRSCSVSRLETAEAARHSEHDAGLDLHNALSGDELSRDLVGLLAAARGSLRIEDLQELTGQRHYALKRRLGSAFGRILRAGGDSSFYDTRSDGRGYLFAHETLLVTALDELGPDVDPYRAQLHDWAQRYADDGWPANTPTYLLHSYGRMVASLGDVRRATALASDVRRHDRMRAVTGSDAVALAEIDAVRHSARRIAPHDLGSLAALGSAAELVARRNRSLHPGIPVALAELGHCGRAVGLARSVYFRADRARAMADVARILASGGDGQAVALAREAVQAVNWASYEGRLAGGEVTAAAAVTFMTAGREEDALDLLRDLPLAPLQQALTWSEVAAAARRENADCAEELLTQAEQMAEELAERAVRIRALGAFADLCRAFDPHRAERLYDLVAELADGDPGKSVAVPAAAAGALCEALPAEAVQYARLAAERWRTNHGDAGLLSTVRVLAQTGCVDTAQDLVGAVRDPLETASAWFVIAEGRARQGRAGAAWAAVRRANERGMVLGSGAAAVARTLAASGQIQGLEADVLAACPDPWVAAGALAAAAQQLAGHARDEAETLLGAAERAMERPGQETPDPGRDEVLAALVPAFVTVGNLADAGQICEAVSTEAWRIRALAATSMVLVRRGAAGRSDALRLAEAAVERARRLPTLRDEGIAAARALGYVGAAERALALADSGAWPDVRDEETGHAALRARIGVIAGLRSHDPAKASALADTVEEELLSRQRGRTRQLLLAELLAAVWPWDAQRGHRLVDVMRRASHPVRAVGKGSWLEGVLSSVLTLEGEHDGAGGELADVRLSEMGRFQDSDWVGALAVALAALGDGPGAERLAEGITDESEQGKVFVSVAVYLAGTEGGLLAEAATGTSSRYLRVTQALAALLAPPDTARTLDHARRLLSRALIGPGWFHAIPVLAQIDPDAVHQVRHVVFAHLGLTRTDSD